MSDSNDGRPQPGSLSPPGGPWRMVPDQVRLACGGAFAVRVQNEPVEDMRGIHQDHICCNFCRLTEAHCLPALSWQSDDRGPCVLPPVFIPSLFRPLSEQLQGFKSTVCKQDATVLADPTLDQAFNAQSRPGFKGQGFRAWKAEAMCLPCARHRMGPPLNRPPR